MSKTLLEIDHNWAGSADREKTLEDNCFFGIGDRVRIGKLPENMGHFGTEGKVGTVIGRTLTTDFGIVDYGYYATYVLHLDGIGNSAWYSENALEAE